jgi:hypothetical protein
MAFNYGLPKVDADRGAFITTPLAADTALATGVLTLKDEAGTDVLDVKCRKQQAVLTYCSCSLRC